MHRSKLFRLILVAFAISLAYGFGCAKDDTHWGQNFDIDSKWWKQEGQSWDRNSNIFMTIGYSNPDWKNKDDARKSADMDARSQVASFMNSLVKNYMQEVRSKSFSLSESIVEASARETVTGSVIVARRYEKGRKQYLSLIKVDLTDFFARIFENQRSLIADRMKRDEKAARDADLDARIQERIDSAKAQLTAAEAPAVEKSIDKSAPNAE